MTDKNCDCDSKVGFGCTGCVENIDKIGEDEINENPFLDCLPWDGSEKSLPAGVKTLIPKFSAKSLVRSWEVLDVESDEGFRTVKKPGPDDVIIGAVINEKAYAKILEVYGKNAMLFRRADTGQLYTRESWADVYSMDPLELQAIKEGRNL